MRSLGEVEGSLWHLRAEIFGWKDVIESLIHKVDTSISQITGLGQILQGSSKGLNENELHLSQTNTTGARSREFSRPPK